MKTIKVSWNGKRLKDVYPYATKWQVVKYRVKRLVRKCLIVSLGMAIVYGAFLVGQASRPIEIKAEQDTLGLKVNELKGALLDQLKACENGEGAVIVFDSNKKASVGSYQFQIDTVKHYYKAFYGQELSTKEAVLLALDDEKARDLASKIIFEKNGLNNWYNCSKKGLEVQLTVINKIK